MQLFSHTWSRWIPLFWVKSVYCRVEFSTGNAGLWSASETDKTPPGEPFRQIPRLLSWPVLAPPQFSAVNARFTVPLGLPDLPSFPRNAPNSYVFSTNLVLYLCTGHVTRATCLEKPPSPSPRSSSYTRVSLRPYSSSWLPNPVIGTHRAVCFDRSTFYQLNNGPSYSGFPPIWYVVLLNCLPPSIFFIWIRDHHKCLCYIHIYKLWNI